MEINQAELIEQRLNRITRMAICLQCVGILIAISLLYFKPTGYKEIGHNFSISALIVSFIISRVYIHTGKKLEEFKAFSSNERETRKNEYLLKFFAPYAIWVGSSWFFA